MKEWFRKVGRSSLLVAALLFVCGFAAVQLLRKALQFQGVDPADTSIEFPAVCGLVLGGSAFILVWVFEVIGSGWRWMRGIKPAGTMAAEPAP
jgi:hypothetical protein